MTGLEMTDTQLSWVVRGDAVRTGQCFVVLYFAGLRQRRAAEALNGRSWWAAPGEWAEHRAALAERRRLSRLVPAERWDHLALDVIVEAIRRLRERRGDPNGNPFHPRVLEDLDQVVAVVLEAPARDEYTAGAIENTPELADRFTPAGIERLVRAEVARLQQVATSSLMLSAHTPEGLVVQHQASGMRARFIRDKTNPERGTVLAKPYKIETLDWTDTTPEHQRSGAWWEPFTGLGIGERIFLHAAALLPEVRWRMTAGTEHSERLRARLHATDPWRWESPRCACRKQWGQFTDPAEALAAAHVPRSG